MPSQRIHQQKKIININSLLPETRKRPREAPGFIQSPRGGKGGAAPIFRYFLAFFSDFYFVICLSSPSILVVYDTDNKLSLLSLSLSPDLSCFQLAIPLPSAARLGAPRLRTVLPTHADGAGKAPGPPGGGERANSLLYPEKKNHFCPKSRGEGGASAPKSLRIPPKAAAAGAGGPPPGSRVRGGNFCAKFGRFEAGGEFILIFSLIFRHRRL